jgi:hypothetical protein
MAWTTVRGRRYYRRSRRMGGRVVTEHVTGERLGRMVERLDAVKRERRRFARLNDRLDLDVFLVGIADCLAVDDALGDVLALLAGLCGAYRHRRQWRWARGGKAMANKPNATPGGTLATVLRPAVTEVPALLPPSFAGVPEADRAMLRAAAAGDPAALEQSRKYLTQQRYARVWGDAVYAARCWIISQTCGTDRLSAKASHSFADHLAADLGWERATALEKLAITRVVNNWLMVGALEAKAGGLAAGGRERGRVERSLAQAERRLAQSLKMLAFFQGEPTLPSVPRLPLASATVPAARPADGERVAD